MHIVNSLEDGRAVLQRALAEQVGRVDATNSGSPFAGERVPAAALEQQLQQGAPLQLCSPPYAACYAGVNYYRHLVDALHVEFPGMPFTFTLCCGDDAAIAHDALRMGFTHILCDAPLDPLTGAAKP